MLPMLARNWWAVALRGVAAIAFGIIAFVVPGLTVGALVLLFGAYAFVDGIAALLAALRRDRATGAHHWAMAAIGAAGITAGVLTFLDPALTALALLYLIATWAILVGLIQLVAAFNLRRQLEREFWLVLGALASIVFGIILLASPDVGLLSLVWLIGAYAIVFGVTSLILALRLRGIYEAAMPSGRASG